VDVNGNHHYATIGGSEPEWEEKPTITVDATKTSVPGTYPISVTGGKLKGYNGFEIIEPGMLTVKKANLQVIARDTTLCYRSFWKPEFFEYVGFKNGEDVSVIDKAPIPSYYQLLDEKGRIKTLVHHEVYHPTGGEDDCYHLVFPQQEEYSSLRWGYGNLTVVPDTIQFSTGPLLTINYGDEGPLLPNESTYDQFPAEEMPEGYGVYRVVTKNGASWGLISVGRLDAGDHLLTQDTLFVNIGLDTEEARSMYYNGDAGYVAYYVPTLRVEPAALYARVEPVSWTAKTTCFNVHDQYKFIYDGFKWDDDESVFTQKPTWRLANGELPLPGYHQLELDREGIAKNYTLTYSLSSIAIRQATPDDYFSQFNSEYSGQYECELKWKDDMEFKNTYVGGTDVLKVEDYGIFECIDSIFPGRYKDYWNTVGRFAKRYDYAGSYTLNDDEATGVSTITYLKEGDINVNLQLNLPREIFEIGEYGPVAYITKHVNVSTILKGDANGDGKVNIADAVAIMNAALGKTSVFFDKTAADVNGDGRITVTDAVGLVDVILGR